MKKRCEFPTKYFLNNKLVEEKTEASWGMVFLYTSALGKIVRPCITHRFTNKLYGWFQKAHWSKYKIAPFIKRHAIDMEQFEQPPQGYQSFNEFFIRKLKPGQRTIDQDPRSFASPADSKLFVIPQLRPDAHFFVKGVVCNLELFLCDKQLADEYRNGTLLCFRLAPYDYHRFHFPTSGVPEYPITISGGYESVNPLVYKTGEFPLLTNERHIIKFHTESFDTIIMVAVGALMVGKIIETYTPLQQAAKGAEAGYFAFGGSTVVLLVKPNRIKLHNVFIENSAQGYETAVTMGQVLGESL